MFHNSATTNVFPNQMVYLRTIEIWIDFASRLFATLCRNLQLCSLRSVVVCTRTGLHYVTIYEWNIAVREESWSSLYRQCPKLYRDNVTIMLLNAIGQMLMFTRRRVETLPSSAALLTWTARVCSQVLFQKIPRSTGTTESRNDWDRWRVFSGQKKWRILRTLLCSIIIACLVTHASVLKKTLAGN